MEATEITNNPWVEGGKIGRRYLLKNMFMAKPEYVIWKAEDEILQISCFLFVPVSMERQKLREIAWNMINRESEDTCPVVHGMYRAAGKDMLIISCGKKTLREEELAVWFQPDERKPEVIETIDGSVSRPETAEKLLPCGHILNRRYEIIAPLGIGGFGITYLCMDRILLRNVAIKEYLPEGYAVRDGKYVSILSGQTLDAFRQGYQLFLQEIKLTTKMNHVKHLPIIYDAFEENDTAYMVMHYEEGESVGREYRARSYCCYTPKRMCELILPVLDGLQKLHQKHIIHCDISPANMIHKKDGDVVLIDFGSAMDLQEKEALYNVSLLKKDFAAPEQFLNAKAGALINKEGPWTDIYALGATMYYLLTGYKATDALKRIEKKEKLVLPKEYGVDIKRGWIKLVFQCMEIEPSKRIKSVEELMKQIHKLLKKEK